MGLLDKVFKMISGDNEKLDEVNIDKAKFLKEFSMENKQLKDLELLASKLKEGEKKEKVNKSIYYQKQGLYGEKKVYFELKNTFLPIICLHDIRLEYKDYIAQLDFVIISSRYICVLEAKKLNGNIRINSNGDFIRRFKDGNEQGMYSPISQNQRHINILKYVLEKKLNIDIPFESLVILANEKTIVDASKASEEIKKSIVKYDRIVSRIEKLQKENKVVLTLEDMNKIAKLLIKSNKPKTYNNLGKFSIKEEDFINPKDIKQFEVNNNKNVFASRERLTEELKKFRLEESKRLKKKAYLIFNNAEMEELLDKMPKNKTQLLKVKGFGERKVEQYGDKIIEILNYN